MEAYLWYADIQILGRYRFDWTFIFLDDNDNYISHVHDHDWLEVFDPDELGPGNRSVVIEFDAGTMPTNTAKIKTEHGRLAWENDASFSAYFEPLVRDV